MYWPHRFRLPMSDFWLIIMDFCTVGLFFVFWRCWTGRQKWWLPFKRTTTKKKWTWWFALILMVSHCLNLNFCQGAGCWFHVFLGTVDKLQDKIKLYNIGVLLGDVSPSNPFVQYTVHIMYLFTSPRPYLTKDCDLLVLSQGSAEEWGLSFLLM